MNTVNEQNLKLSKAISSGNVCLVKSAIRKGASVNHLLTISKRPSWCPLGDLKLSVLSFSVLHKNTKVVKELIRAKANVSFDEEVHYSPLHVAVLGGKIEIVRLLLGIDGIDVNIKDVFKKTPLHYSVMRKFEVFRELIKHGADVNAIDGVGWTPIREVADSFSSEGNMERIVLALAGHPQHNLNENCINALRDLRNKEKTVYLKALREMVTASQENSSSCTRFVRLLTQHFPVDDFKEVLSDQKQILNNRDYFGRSLMHDIVSLGYHSVVAALVSHGIKINVTDARGQTLLHSAMPIGNKETIRVLLKHGCQVDARDVFGRTVLHLAAFYGHSSLIEMFIEEWNMDPNATDKSRRNSLHHAVMNRQDEAVKILLQKGADHEMKDGKGLRPEEYLHPDECSNECPSLTYQLLKRRDKTLPSLYLSDRLEEETFEPDITHTPKLVRVRKIPGIGSVHSIKKFSLPKFRKKIKGKICEILHEAIHAPNIEVVPCGSSTEECKVGFPDEFDFLHVINTASNEPKTYAGYTDMQHISDQKHGNENDRRCPYGSFSIWLWSRLTTWWNQQQSNGKRKSHSGGTFQIPFAPIRHPDRSTAVNWIWLYSDDIFKLLPISIDLVPALERSFPTCHIVPKVPYEGSFLSEEIRQICKGRLTVGRVSYPTAEVAHMRGLKEYIRNVYVSVKCLRMPEVCGFKLRDENGNNCIVSDIVTSYRLKTVFFHLSTMFKKANLSHGRMVLMVYECLESCLERSNLPMFFEPAVNVLIGSRLRPEECLKVVRVMTQFVKKLYERDYRERIRARDHEREQAMSSLIPSCLLSV